MKNIHLIATDKPSRLRYFCGKLEIMYLVPKKSDITFQNIYITSDEEIKEGDWFLEKAGRQYPIQWNGIEKLNFHCKKIILTTDGDLIKDGVQAIDDEFLEWFVKNPSCEEVKVIDDVECLPMPNIHINKHIYKIIIPKEEPKQETLEEVAKSYIENTMRFSFNSLETKTQANRMLKCAEFGAKWQAERMYSEEDLKSAYMVGKHGGVTQTHYEFNEWFEQFKKK
jgi:hypothetical protein